MAFIGCLSALLHLKLNKYINYHNSYKHLTKIQFSYIFESYLVSCSKHSDLGSKKTSSFVCYTFVCVIINRFHSRICQSH